MSDVQAPIKTDSPSAKDVASSGGQPKPSGATGQVSTPDAEKLAALQTFADEYANKKHSKLDKQIHGLTSERDGLKKSLETLSAEVEQLKQSGFSQRREKAIAEARSSGDPIKIKETEVYFQTLEDMETARAKLTDINAEIEAKADLRERLNEGGKIEKARELEAETGVSAELILQQFNTLKLTDPEQMEAIAETLKGKVAKAPGEPQKLRHPDAVSSVGGIGVNVDQMSPDEKIRYALSQPKK